jgi:hypothetical protein
MRRSYYVILVRYDKDEPWMVYKGNRGGLDPSLFLTLKSARLQRKQIWPYWQRGCTCIVPLFEAGTGPDAC